MGGVSELGLAPHTTLYYRIHLHNYQNLMSRWKMEPLQLFDVAQRFKTKARQYFDLGRWHYAFQRYEKALEYLEADEKMDGEEKRRAQREIAVVHCNLAMVHLKRSEFTDCIRECNKVLRFDDSNVKAWCRKGQSRMMLSEYKKAKADLRHALSLEPENRFIKRMIKLNRKKKRRYNDNQKRLYGGMFDRYNEFQKEKHLNKERERAQGQSQGKALDDTHIDYGDIDKYDNDGSESDASINFDFDSMDESSVVGDTEDSGDEEYDDDDDVRPPTKSQKKKKTGGALEAIDE